TWGSLILAVALALVARTANADVISVDENTALFGTLSQRAITACGNNTNEDNSSACGPVAATNSFTYLQNRYPQIYGTNLIQGTPENTAELLGGVEYMNCSCDNGTTIGNFISGKEAWINNFAPNTTRYEVQNYFGGTAAQAPDLGFLSSMLAEGEDVELLVGFYQTDADGDLQRAGGHYVTLTGVSCDDTDNDGTCSAGDTPLTISYDDPWGSTQNGLNDAVFGTQDLSAANFTVEYSADPAGGPDNNDLTDPFLEIDSYLNGNTTLIEAAVAESPIPEPSGPALILGAIIGLAVIRRLARPQRRAAPH
ncbi:MAG: hypothetical protein ACREFQ_09675, partial [Stellaceae bacterium]